MPNPESESRRYEIRYNASVGQSIRDLHGHATQAGAVKAFRAAYQHLFDRLEIDPHMVGEPLYRLKPLRMRVCCVVLRPLILDFAVSEHSPVVFIRGIRML
jgi:hypothetical protein